MTVSTWALPAEVLTLFDERLAELKPDLAVESGSGESTRILAQHSKQVVSLEHEPAWAESTLQRLGPATNVDLRLAPIVPTDTPVGPLPWYDTVLPTGIDFALIDGPPRVIGRHAAGHMILPNMNPSGEVWVDDYQEKPDRFTIRDLVDGWCRTYDWRVADVLSFDLVNQAQKQYRDRGRIAVLHHVAVLHSS